MSLSNIVGDIDAELERVDDYRNRLREAKRALTARQVQSDGGAPAEAPAPRKRRDRRRRSVTDNGIDRAVQIVQHVKENPGSTAGEVAEALGIKRNSVSTKMTDMARAGKLNKEERGYSAP